MKYLKPRDKEYAIFDAKCDELAIRVQPNGAKSWVYWRRQNKKTRRVTLARMDDLSIDQARAKYKSHQLSMLLEKGETQIPETSIIFNKLASEFLAAKKGVYQKSSLKSLKAYLTTQLVPAFGKYKMREITTPMVADWFYEYTRISAGGANQAKGHFTTMFNWGVRQGHIPTNLHNPCSAIMTNKRRPRGQSLTTHQLRNLGWVLKSADPRQETAAHVVRLILTTGCRSGKILRLR